MMPAAYACTRRNRLYASECVKNQDVAAVERQGKSKRKYNAGFGVKKKRRCLSSVVVQYIVFYCKADNFVSRVMSKMSVSRLARFSLYCWRMRCIIRTKQE